MTGERILFVADAGPAIGGGHVMRSLTLARALEARGAECAFRSHPDGDAVLDVFARDLFRVEDDAGFDALEPGEVPLLVVAVVALVVEKQHVIGTR